MRRRFQPSAKALAPICVFLVSAAVFGVMVVTRPSAESTRPGPVAPVVSVVRVQPERVRLPIAAQGTVEPRTESDLVTEVAGRVVWASRQLAAGGFFEADEVLLRIDPRDYEVALEGARASLARAESDLAHAEADLAREHSMRKSGASSRARLEDAERDFARAKAGLRESRVQVRRGELDLERCQIRAPFAGRVRDKHVDLGQYVTPGAPVARLFSVDYAEIRLPISDADLAFLDLPLTAKLETASGVGDAVADSGPLVTLSADFAGERRAWAGRVVRTEGALDRQTRMVNVVARVDDPYGLVDAHSDSAPLRSDSAPLRSDSSPLPIGLFVEASIEGRPFDGIFELPRSALRRRNTVWVVDDDGRLEHRAVQVLRSVGDRTFIRSGLQPGERVITSALDAALDGMQVQSIEIPGSRALPAVPAATADTTS